MKRMKSNAPIRWVQVLHWYQPPRWSPTIIRRVAREAYEPLVAHLEHLPDVHVTLNICASLSEQLFALGYDALLSRIARLAEAGQIEFLGSAAFHPILPLLPDAEFRRQIELNAQINQMIFGSTWKPVGFFPPELAVSDRLFAILSDFGFAYAIADDIARTGTRAEADSTRRHVARGTDLSVVFRSQHLSDEFLNAAVTDEHTFHDAVGRNRTTPFITAIDGENLGHHRREMSAIWLNLVSSPHFITETVSEYRTTCRGREIFSLHPSSWSSREDELAAHIPYGLWQSPNNPIHQLLWGLTDLARSAAQQGPAEAREALDRALNSDHFWWASASPWWSVELVLQGARRLVRVIELSGQSAILNTARATERNIAKLCNNWHHQGVASERQRESRAYYNRARFFGGERLPA